MASSDTRPSRLARWLAPIAELRDGEGGTALLLFLYSFLAMTSYNIVKPVTRSQFISSLGADNLPWVQFGAGMLIGVLMQGYTKAIAAVPRRWTIPVTQAGMIVLLVTFWVLFTQVGSEWVSVGFYLFGLILGILLISQVWTLANDIYDPRQAKRLFGLIGGGSSLGGATGAALTAGLVESLGTETLLLWVAASLVASVGLVQLLWRRGGIAPVDQTSSPPGLRESMRHIAASPYLRAIAWVIGLASFATTIAGWQFKAIAKAEIPDTDQLAAFFGLFNMLAGGASLVMQLVLTGRVLRTAGVGVALFIVPLAMASTSVAVLVLGSLAAVSALKASDQVLRYSIDKSTVELLYLPLPADVKYRAKPFIDVTVDRLSKGAGALLILVLIKDWGLGLSWQQLSYASLTMVGLWVITTIRARKEYVRTFRNNLEQQNVLPSEVKFTNPDPRTVETLVSELAHPEPRRVLYAIDLLDAMDKRALVSPLLLWHTSGQVRARALRVADGEALAAAVGAVEDTTQVAGWYDVTSSGRSVRWLDTPGLRAGAREGRSFHESARTLTDAPPRCAPKKDGRPYWDRPSGRAGRVRRSGLSTFAQAAPLHRLGF